jgi:glutamate-1-semialdehyde 2,1-aminomutase
MAPSVVETTSAGSELSAKVASGATAKSAQAAVDAATARFVASHPRSAELFAQATENLPGGNTRTLLYSAPFPVILKSGNGYQVTSEDGHVYAC